MMNQDIFQTTQKILERKTDHKHAIAQLKDLENQESRFKWYPVTDQGSKLASLKQKVEKLTFANNAYRSKAIKTEDGIVVYNLNFRMHRRPNGLAEERKLLKQINSSRNNADDDLDPCLPEDRIRGRLQYLLDIYQILTGRTWHRKEHIERMGLGSMDVKVVMKEMKELEWVLEKGFANAPPKGKTWNSLPSKQELKDQIKVMEQDSDCRRKKHLQLRAEIKQAKAKVKAIEKEISSLQRKLNEL